MRFTIEECYNELFAHISAFWPTNLKEKFTWELGRIKNVLPRFCVIRVSPKTIEEPWIYITHGVWEVDMKKTYRVEFFIVCPYENPRHVETLAMLACYHADSGHFLDIGSSIAIGRGWLDQSDCEYLLVSLPYPYGPKLEMCMLDEKFIVRYLWLLPITKDENDYLKRYGVESLEQKFDEAEIDFLDPNRPSVTMPYI